MFDVSQETKEAVIKYIRECHILKEGVTDETLNQIIDNIAVIVKRQFSFW